MKKGIDVVISSKILSERDSSVVKDIWEELNYNFDRVQMFRTRTEMEISVLNDTKFPTPASKYWQAVREQNVMFNELLMLSFDYRKNDVELRRDKLKFEEEKDEFEKELLAIEVDKKEYIKKNQERIAHARIREILHWSDIKKREASKMTEVELIDVDNHQLISYTRRWINESLVMGSEGSPSERRNLLGQLQSGIVMCIKKGLLDEMLLPFPDEIKNKIKIDYEKVVKQIETKEREQKYLKFMKNTKAN